MRMDLEIIDCRIKKLKTMKTNTIQQIRKTMGYWIIMLILTIGIPLMTAQADDPVPPPPDNHGQTGNQENGAPIGGGTFILLALGAGYGARKVWLGKRKGRDESPHGE